MMKKLILIFSIFYALIISAQEDTDVSIQGNTTMPIPYAKVFFEGKHYYKNTDDKGRLKLEKGEKIIKIIATGFEDFFPDKNQSQYILMAKKPIERTEILPKNKVKIKIGKLDKRTNYYAGATDSGLIEAQYLPYKKHYPETSFIKSISFLSSCSIKDQKQPIILRLYKNNNGQPGELYQTIDFVVYCRPGKSTNKIDFSKKPLIFPKEGLFVRMEWINIPTNQVKYDYIKNNDGSLTRIDKLDTKPEIIGPGIGYELTTETNSLWLLSNRGWENPKILKKPSKINFEIVILINKKASEMRLFTC